MMRGNLLLVTVAMVVLVVAGQSAVLALPRCQDRSCSHSYSPVCGTDGETYWNHCYFKAAQCRDYWLGLRNRGECVECPSYCPIESRPVCGSDGETYTNGCTLRRERDCNNKPDLYFVKQGHC